MLGWALLGAAFGWKAWREQAQQATNTTQVPVSIATLLQGKNDSTWLLLPRRGSQMAVLRTTTKTLQLGTMGERWIGYQNDTQHSIARPTEPSRWKRTLTQWLANPAVADTNLQWAEARQKLTDFVADTEIPMTKVQDADLLLFHRLVSKVNSLQKRKRSTYLLDRDFFTSELATLSIPPDQHLRLQLMPSTLTDSALWYGLAGVCWLLMALGIGFWAKSRLQFTVDSLEVQADDMEVVNEAASESQAQTPPTSDPLSPTSDLLPPNADLLPPTSDHTLTYLKKFYQRYGKFFEKLQQMSIPPTPDERAWTVRQLTEMALHAHSLAYAANIGQTQLLDQKPNGQQLLHDKSLQALLDTAQVRPLSTEPYETEVKYRVLYAILKDLNVRELDVALENSVAIPQK